MEERPATRLYLETAQDMFDKLLWEDERLRQSWSVYDSFNFIVTAHHLYTDWIKPGIATSSQIGRKKALPVGAKTVFRAVLDISNGSKHWRMTRPESLSAQVVTRVSQPVVGCWLAWAANKPMAYFKFAEYDMSMAQLSYYVMKYFEWILNGEGLPFPDELAESLEGNRRVAQERAGR